MGWDEYCCFKIYQQHQVFQRKSSGNVILVSCGMVCQAGKSPCGPNMPLAWALRPAPMWRAWDGSSRCILCWAGQKRCWAHTQQCPVPCLTGGVGEAVIVTCLGSFGSWMILGQAQEGHKPSIHRSGATKDWLQFWTQFGVFLLPCSHQAAYSPRPPQRLELFPPRCRGKDPW